MSDSTSLPNALFNAREMRTLIAVCDTLIPALNESPDPDGFYARSASDLQVAQAIAEAIATLTEPMQQSLAKVALDLLDQPTINTMFGAPFCAFADMPLTEQTRLLNVWEDSPLELLRRAFQAFKRMALFFFYALVDESGCNANWPALGYPGPAPVPEKTEKPIKPLEIVGDTTLSADVVIV